MNRELEQYILQHIEPQSDILYQLERETHLKTLFPRMLSGHLQGEMLTMLCKMIQPENILEIGTFTGYSAICMARALAENGKLHTIEINDELIRFSKKYFEKAKLAHKIELYTGDALNIIPTINQTFDLVFIDGDKRQYSDYYHCVFNKVAPNGYIIADNVLWYEKVVETPEKCDEYTKGIIDFNDMVQNDNRVENTIVPVRDGLMVIRKKGK